jgi:single-strand DNA-binding protein
MTEAAVSFAGNLTDDPELRHTEGGIARARFRVAVSGRREQEASFFTVIVWRDQAEHAAESRSKGSRVVVVGRRQQGAWTAEDGSTRSIVEVVAGELGAKPAMADRHAGQDHQGHRQVAFRMVRKPHRPIKPQSCWDFPHQCRSVAFRTHGTRGTSHLQGCAGAASGGDRCDRARAWPWWSPWA